MFSVLETDESVIVIADTGNRAQIVYSLDNGTGYKMGWIPSSAIKTNSTSASLKGDVNNDGKVDQTDLDLLKKYMVGINMSINQSNADMNDDGQITIVDVSRLADKVNNQTLSLAPTPATQINLDVPLYKQTDPQWKKKTIGSNTIGAIGCTVTSLTMKYNYHNHTNLTPPEMVEKLRPFSNNDIIWDNVKNRLGYTTELVTNKPRLDNGWLTKIYNQLKHNNPVVIGAYSYHWVVVKGYTGTSTTNFNAADFQINDPSNNFTNLQQFINKYNGGLRGIVY